jgi:hypothetical protein
VDNQHKEATHVFREACMNDKVRQLRGGNLGDIDLISQDKVAWEQSKCPWNEDEGVERHVCAVKYTSICKYFCGVKYLDTILCSYPYENIDVLTDDEIDRPLVKCVSCGRQHDADKHICPHCGYDRETTITADE